ncbi:663_t:CDS:2 [Acaulospora morrowiae]|uniref:663_t:CDS:1 n=1 Tax=Acaulospora morrowiae TaxID=94023 RepID=A0A9N8YRT2_9GLOM|nr:663_t:CDS:2 [Acaulospora morrowiae]
MTLSSALSNALIYLTMIAFLFVGIYAGFTKTKNKQDFLSSIGTQTALALAANWFASTATSLYPTGDSDLGSSVLYAYPEVGTLAGLLGVFWYAFGSTVPLWIFAWLGPMMRRKCPEGFTLTTFILERFGRINQIYISLMSMAYMFCYMVSELSAVGAILNYLTNLDPLVPTIMIALTTTIYTAYGGFRASLLTDSVQGWAIIILLVISAIGFGVDVKIDTSKIGPSHLLESNTLGWELAWIMPIAVTFANLFHEGYWQRTFASKNDRELVLSTVYGSIMLFPTLFIIGFTGMIAYWAGTWTDDGSNPGYLAFFTLFSLLPDWVVAFVVILTVSLSCSAYDTLQSAMVATMSNDLFNNKLPLIAIRALTLIFNIPAVWLGLKNLDVLEVFLIGDLLAAAAMPPVLLGLADSLYFLNWCDALIGGIGGMFSVFATGAIYYNSASSGINLILLPDGLYSNDYSVLIAFIAAPFGAVFFTFFSFALRLGGMYIWALIKGQSFEFPKRKEKNVEEEESRFEKENSNVVIDDSENRNIV